MLAIKSRQPYFGPYLACRKSWPQIYWYQQRLIKYASQSLPLVRLNILEIGSWAGASAYSWCATISQYFGGGGSVTCVDIWNDEDPEFESQLKDQALNIKEIFHHNIEAGGFDGHVQVMHASSDQAFEKLTGRQFDLIYIDGGHTYSQVCRDLQNAIGLIGVDGILCGDDLEVQAEEVAPEQLQTASKSEEEWTTDPATGEGYHPGVTRAIAELIGPVSNWGGFWAVRKTRSGWTRIPLDEIDADIPRPLAQYDHEGNKKFDL